MTLAAQPGARERAGRASSDYEHVNSFWCHFEKAGLLKVAGGYSVLSLQVAGARLTLPKPTGCLSADCATKRLFDAQIPLSNV